MTDFQFMSYKVFTLLMRVTISVVMLANISPAISGGGGNHSPSNHRTDHAPKIMLSREVEMVLD